MACAGPPPPPLLARGGKGFRMSVWSEHYLPHSWATCVCGLGHHGSWNAVQPTLVNSIICCQRELPVGKVKARSLLKSDKVGFPIFCNQRKSPLCWSFVADKYDTFDNCLQQKNTFSLGHCSNLPTLPNQIDFDIFYFDTFSFWNFLKNEIFAHIACRGVGGGVSGQSMPKWKGIFSLGSLAFLHQENSSETTNMGTVAS